jgi:hypothetical protein
MHVVAEIGPWLFGWTAIAGIATAMLAVFTAGLAFSTRALVRETDQDVRAAWRPILAPEGVPEMTQVGAVGDRIDVLLVFNLANTGRGPALNCAVDGRQSRSTFGIVWTGRRVSTIAVERYDIVELRGTARVDETRAGVGDHHSFTATYEDVARNRFRSTFVIKSDVGVLSVHDIEVEDLHEKTKRRGWPR